MSAPEPFVHTDLLPLGPDTTEYRLVTREGVSVEKDVVGRILASRLERHHPTYRRGHA